MLFSVQMSDIEEYGNINISGLILLLSVTSGSLTETDMYVLPQRELLNMTGDIFLLLELIQVQS